jgi:hypothetical protein
LVDYRRSVSVIRSFRGETIPPGRSTISPKLVGRRGELFPGPVYASDTGLGPLHV